MKPTGNLIAALLGFLLTVGSGFALGEVQVHLDRERVALGDTLRLTITATEGESLSDAILNPLHGDFEILQRSSSNNTRIINGNLSQSRQLIVDLTPLREGRLEIPSLNVGNSSTPAIPVVVGPAPDSPSGGEHVVFEAQVDRENVYVQGQVILTLRVLQSISLEQRSISELKLDNAFVKPLEQHSFQRTIDGRPWQVDEVRYAIFPEQSGTLEIPAQVFSGRVTLPRRNIFDLGRGGQVVRSTTKPLYIDVIPKPAEFTADDWLPLRNLTLEESWSTPPGELRMGESTTRTIRILGEGAQGAQLPPILFTPIDGLKYYPDQPQISEKEVASGLLGIRQDSAAMVPTRAGSFRIPEIRIPWWDTQTEEMRYAVLPAREFTIAAGDGAADSPRKAPLSPPVETTPIDTMPVTASPSAPFGTQGENLLWPLVAAACALGWMLTLVYAWRLRRAVRPKKPAEAESSSEKNAFKRLQEACTSNDARAVRSAILDWAATQYPDAPPLSVEQVAARFNDEELTRELGLLDTCLYGTQRDAWSGKALLACLHRLRSTSRPRKKSGQPTLELYPAH